MKRVLIFLFLILYFFNFVSAYYECSDGGSMSEDNDEILINEKTSINGLVLGLIYSDETISTRKYSAELIVDAYKFSFTGNITSMDIELKDDIETIKLLNLTSDGAEIKIDGESEFVDEDSSENIGDFVVFVSKAEGEYPNATDVEGMVGKKKVTISNDNSTKIVVLDNASYLLELFSASDTNAIITVKKCGNGSVGIKQVQDVINNSINETVEINKTFSQNVSVNDSVGEFQNVTNTSGEIGEGNISQSSGKNSKNIFFILAGIIVLVIIILSVFLIKYLKQEKPASEQNKTN